jgi:hypothetical protein
MGRNVVSHPYRELMCEAQLERDVGDSLEAQALQDDIFRAVEAYSKFLNRHGLLWEETPSGGLRLRASALVVTLDYGRGNEIDIRLKDGALDRVFGNGFNPDPEGGGPADIRHKPPDDDSDPCAT